MLKFNKYALPLDRIFNKITAQPATTFARAYLHTLLDAGSNVPLLSMKDNCHNFPIKLHALLDTEDPDVATWTQHGNGFRINDMERFRDEVLPKYWRHTKMTSFQRQMNLYGFKKINYGDDIGAYYHPLFERGKRELLKDFKRSAIKSSAMDADSTYASRSGEDKVGGDARARPKFVDKSANKAVGNVNSIDTRKRGSLQQKDQFASHDLTWMQAGGAQCPTNPSETTRKKSKTGSDSSDDEFSVESDLFIERLKDFHVPALPNCEFPLDSDLVVFEYIISDEEYMLLINAD